MIGLITYTFRAQIIISQQRNQEQFCYRKIFHSIYFPGGPKNIYAILRPVRRSVPLRNSNKNKCFFQHYLYLKSNFAILMWKFCTVLQVCASHIKHSQPKLQIQLQHIKTYHINRYIVSITLTHRYSYFSPRYYAGVTEQRGGVLQRMDEQRRP